MDENEYQEGLEDAKADVKECDEEDLERLTAHLEQWKLLPKQQYLVINAQDLEEDDLEEDDLEEDDDKD